MKEILIVNNVSELGFRYTPTTDGTYSCRYENYNLYRTKNWWGDGARTEGFTRSEIAATIKSYRRRWANYPGSFEVTFSDIDN